jgi:hypothetical protein
MAVLIATAENCHQVGFAEAEGLDRPEHFNRPVLTVFAAHGKSVPYMTWPVPEKPRPPHRGEHPGPAELVAQPVKLGHQFVVHSHFGAGVPGADGIQQRFGTHVRVSVDDHEAGPHGLRPAEPRPVEMLQPTKVGNTLTCTPARRKTG